MNTPGLLNMPSLAEILLAAEAVVFVALSVGFAAPAVAPLFVAPAVFAAAAVAAAAQHLHIHYAGLQESLQQPL